MCLHEKSYNATVSGCLETENLTLKVQGIICDSNFDVLKIMKLALIIHSTSIY